MALLNTFDFLNRSNNLGLLTDSPLSVKFSTDGIARKRLGESTAKCIATRYVQKTYSWGGYTLSMAKRIASFYRNGNAQRTGYYRRFREYRWDDTLGYTYRTVYKTLTDVNVSRKDGNMYTVRISIDERDDFLVDSEHIPDDYDAWCGAFSAFYNGDEWAAYSGGSATPYLFEKFYDEPLTVVS